MAAGVPADRIHVERFGVPTAGGAAAARHVPQAGDARQARVVVVRDGLRREIDFREGQTNLLGCASAAGMEMPYSCTRAAATDRRQAYLLAGSSPVPRTISATAGDVKKRTSCLAASGSAAPCTSADEKKMVCCTASGSVPTKSSSLK